MLCDGPSTAVRECLVGESIPVALPCHNLIARHTRCGYLSARGDNVPGYRCNKPWQRAGDGCNAACTDFNPRPLKDGELKRLRATTTGSCLQRNSAGPVREPKCPRHPLVLFSELRVSFLSKCLVDQRREAKGRDHDDQQSRQGCPERLDRPMPGARCQVLGPKSILSLSGRRSCTATVCDGDWMGQVSPLPRVCCRK